MRHQLSNYLFSLIFCLLSYASIGQKTTFLTTEDGLSQGTVFDIAKDHDGFMWFYTKDGLNRYDGYDFKVFKNNPSDSTSVPNYLYFPQLFVDSKNRLWIDSKSLYDRNKEIFYNLKKEDHKNVTGLVEDQAGHLWCHNDTAIFQLIVTTIKDGTAPQLKLVEKIDIKGKGHIYGLTALKDGTLLLRTKTDLFKVNKQKKQLELFLENNSGNVTEYPKGTLWIGNGNKLIRFQNGKITPIQFTLNQVPFNSFYHVAIKPNSNKIWLLLEGNEIYIIDLLPLKEYYALDQADKVGLELQGNISSFYDDGKTIWLGSNGYGIQKIMQQQHPFHHLAVGGSTRGAITLANDNLLAVPFFYPVDKKNLSITISEKGYPKQIAAQYNNIFTTKDGKNWKLYGEKGQLFLLQMDKNLLEEAHYSMVYKLNGPRFPNLMEGKNGHLWVGNNEGIIKFDRKKKVPTFIKRKTPLKHYSRSLYQDNAGVFWNCTGGGLIKISIDKSGKMTEQVYQHNPTDRHSLSNNDIDMVLDDPKNPNRYLWVATKGSGLSQLDKKTGKFTHFTIEDGLPNNVVYGILADDDGNLWLSTNNGLSKFNPTEKTFRNFVKSDGLQDNEFNTDGFFKDEKTDIMYFGGVNGITAFHPKKIKLNTFKPKVVISELKIHGEVVKVGQPLEQKGENPLTKAIEYTKKIRLPWYQNQVTLTFAALDLYNPKKNLYQYQLSSVDKDWVLAGTRRSVNYSNLGTGTYTFRLKGTNSDGRWNEEETVLTIVIYPPWYRTNLAYLIYIILLILGIYKLYQNQIRRAKLRTELEFEQKEAARLAEVDKIKTNFFSNITHEFRTPLTLIIEPLRQYLKNPKKEPISKVQLAKNNSERLLNLVNQLLDLSKLESKKMSLELKRGDFLEFVEPIMASFDGLAKQKNIQFIYNTPNELSAFDFDKNKVEKVLFNLISNAIKFTKANGTVTVNVIENTQNQQLQIQVIDTGIGISEKEQPHIFDRFYQVDGSNTREHEGTGIGLALSKELTEVMNGSLTFQSELGKGSVFEILIPMVQNSTITAVNAQTEIHIPSRNIGINRTEKPAIRNLVSPETSEQFVFNPDATNIALIIEDNNELRGFIKSSIEHQYQVIEARNGQEGLELALKHLPNIIISDVMMPIMDGFELCKRVKTDEKTAHIPVILLTAKTAMESVLKGLEYKADAYIRKPFNVEELLLRMKNLIEVRVLLQQKFAQTLEIIPFGNSDTDDSKSPINAAFKDTNLSSFDQRFLTNLSKVVEQNLDNENLTIEDLAKAVTMSRSQLYRKIKALINQSPSEFIRNIRLKAAKQFLEQGKGNITEVAFMVGFSSQKYFSTKFKEKYGVKPSEV
ncbi:MAG: ATP-binding protein [Saprospiraceae bacterium]